MKLLPKTTPLIYLILLLLTPLLPSRADGPCRDQCGTIPVHFPFGIDDGCGAPQFRHMFTCNATSNSLFFITTNGNYKVQSIDYKAQTMTVYDPDMSTCTILQPHHDVVLSDIQYAIIPPSPDTVFALLNCSLDSPILHRYRNLCFDLQGHQCQDLYSSCSSFRALTTPGGGNNNYSPSGGSYYGNPGASAPNNLPGGGVPPGYNNPPPGYYGGSGTIRDTIPNVPPGYYGANNPPPGHSGGGGDTMPGGDVPPGFNNPPPGYGGGSGNTIPGGGVPPGFNNPPPGYYGGGGGSGRDTMPGGGVPPGFNDAPPGYYGGSNIPPPGYYGGINTPPPGYFGATNDTSSAPGGPDNLPGINNGINNNNNGQSAAYPPCCFTGYSTVRAMRMNILDCTHFTSFYNVDQVKGVSPMDWSYGLKFSYSVPDMGCERCVKSGGNCGFDAETEALLCLCSTANNSTRQCGSDTGASEGRTPSTKLQAFIIGLGFLSLLPHLCIVSTFL